MTRRTSAALLVGLIVVATVAGCGRKTLPRPPAMVAPQTVTSVALSVRPTGIEIGWDRSTRYVDGSRMTDLGGFIVERQSFSTEFHEIARVPVTDRGRFRQAKRFEHLDEDVTPDMMYHYRVVAFTLDGYYSAPSGAAAITWVRPDAAATPATSPAASDE